MVKTWVADISELLKIENYQKLYEQMPVERKRKAEQLHHIRDKVLSVGAWALLELARGEAKVDEHAIYNLSHSGRFVLCSLDDSGMEHIEVGCDIEEIKKFKKAVVRRFFCPNEQRYIIEQPTEELQTEAFYRYWVLKESFMKATRRGMALGLNTFEIEIQEELPKLIKRPDDILGSYRFKEYTIQGIPYKIAVCTTSMDIEDKIFIRQWPL